MFKRIAPSKWSFKLNYFMNRGRCNFIYMEKIEKEADTSSKLWKQYRYLLQFLASIKYDYKKLCLV